MAQFKSKYRVGMGSNLFESFSALTKADVKDGSIAGVASPYSADHKQAVSMALINADDKAREISSGISKLYRKVEYGTKIDSVKYLEDFNRFSTLLLQALKINDVLSGDEIILKKLADILSYAYVKKNKGDFKIYSSFEDAKAVTLLVYKTVKKIGLNFLTPDIDDVVQKVLFSVLYKPKKDDLGKKPESKGADKLSPKPPEGDSNGKPATNNGPKQQV